MPSEPDTVVSPVLSYNNLLFSTTVKSNRSVLTHTVVVTTIFPGLSLVVRVSFVLAITCMQKSKSWSESQLAVTTSLFNILEHLMPLHLEI
jgi:hypothetical protein